MFLSWLSNLRCSAILFFAAFVLLFNAAGVHAASDVSRAHDRPLRLAIVSGTLEVTYDGRTIRYRSLGELKAALQQAEDWLAGPHATARRPTYGVAGFSRGT